MNNVKTILLKALANLEQNITLYKKELQHHTEYVAGFQLDIQNAQKAQQEIREALQKLEESTNENTQSKETTSRSTTTKKRK